MGGLVSTVGTRLLISHFNRAFSAPRITHMRTDPSIGDPSGTGETIAWYFGPGGLAQFPNIDLLWISQNMKHRLSPRPHNEVFLPDDASRRSPNAEKRWLYFLTQNNPNVLTLPNHTAIKNAIYQGLNSVNGSGNPMYNRIEFDCVDSDQVGGQLAQTVLSSDENDDHGTLYLKIVLVTPPIDPNSQSIIAGLPPLDPQP
jgi:hypothetical protein